MSRYDTFILRIWTDERERSHGQIKHVATREEADFIDMDRAVKFILEHVHRSDRHERNLLKRNESGEEV